jgi:uncharacterized YccA/Bax inhibitor family protein
MRSHHLAVVGMAIFALIVIAFQLAPEMVSNAAPMAMAFGGSSGVPVELPPLW